MSSLHPCFVHAFWQCAPSTLRTNAFSGARLLSHRMMTRPRVGLRKARMSTPPPPEQSPQDLPGGASAEQGRNDGRATSGMFGIRLQTNGDVIKFGIAAIAFCYAVKTFLEFLGTPDLLAGQLTTAFICVLSLVAWVSTYVFRVGTKGMTYAQQLRDYEDEVIRKRYEELSEEELAALREELSDDV